MALRVRSNGLSNEAIYRENWASYVDSAISRHQSSGAPGVGDPIDLRDVMRLEELLSRIEHAAAATCQGDGQALGTSTPLLLEQQEAENKAPARTRGSRCDGARPRGKYRTPLKIIPRLPALCQSPSSRNSAPSLESPCSASGHGDQDGAPPDLCRSGSKDERQQEEPPACSPRRLSEHATTVVTEKETGNAKPAGKLNRRDACISTPSLVAGKVAAVVCLFEGLTNNAQGGRDDQNKGVSHDKCQASSDGDGRTSISEKPRHPASPDEPRLERCLDPERSPRLVPLDSELVAPVPRDISSPSLQTVGDARGAQADRPLYDDDDYCTPRMTRCERHTVVAETPCEQEGEEACISAEEAQSIESVVVDALSPSARLDVTYIEAEEAASPEERLPSALSQDCLGLLDGTVLDLGQGDSCGEISGVGMTATDMATADMAAADGEGTLLSFVGQDPSPLQPSGNDSSSATEEVAPFDLTNDQQSWEREREVSAGGSQSPRDGGLSDACRGCRNSPNDSILRRSRTPESVSRVRDNSTESAASAHSGSFARHASSSARGGSSECENRSLSLDDLGEHGAESPDVVLRGSVSPGSDNEPRGSASDHSWVTDALGRRCRSDGRDDGLSFAMQQSQDSHFGDRTFGSTLSPAIGGFGIDAADALSPLHANPLSVDDLDGVGNGGLEGFSDGGLSPSVSAGSDSTVGPYPTFSSRQEQSMAVPNEASEETHPRTPDASWLSDSKALSATTPMGQVGGNVSKEFASPASSLREPLAQRRKGQRHQASVQHPMTPERRLLVSDSRTELRDERSPPGRYGYTSPPASGGAVGEDPRSESFLDTAQSLAGGSNDRDDQVSIGSFSESEIGGDSFRDETEGGKGRFEGDAEVSLVEGTPRQRGVGSGESLAGFYAPLPVANRAKAPKDPGLSILQRSALQWMAWRETGDAGEGQRGEGTETAARLESSLSGGMLGHLSSEEASACVVALIQQEAANAPGGKGDRAGRLQAETGLPRGTNLVIAPTKDAAEVWSNKLGAGGGLSVLNYVMPLKERRLLSAKQVAAFQVVVTTYDILKAKEVPRAVDASVTSPSTCVRNSNKWNTRDTPARRRAASKTGHMVSLLHGVWWHRVVADGAQLLVNQRNARATAALSLLGRARWCVVEREGMAAVESASERMRSLAAFLRVPDVVPLVEAAGCLFYHSRPTHVAPIACRGPGPDTISTEDGSPGSRRLPHNTRVKRGAGDPRALASRLTADGNGRRDSHVGEGSKSDVAGVAGTSVEGSRERDGGGGVGTGLSRDDVRYVATTLRLRKAHGVKPRETGARREER